jgi:hypothetical protein
MRFPPVLTRLASNRVALFATVYASSAVLMLVYRTVFIPLFEPGSAAGLMGGDPTLYHQLALELLENVRTEGWRSWTLWPEGQAPAGILAIIYALVGANPLAIIPLNAALHAVATWSLFSIAARFAPAPAALLASIPFWLSPYHMLWYSQPNKDSVSTPGALLVVGGFIHLARAWRSKAVWQEWAAGLALLLVGAALAAVVRPYLAKVAGIAGVIVLMLFGAHWMARHVPPRFRLPDVGRLLSLGVIIALIYTIAQVLADPTGRNGILNNVDSSVANALANPERISWRRTEWLPAPIDYTIYAVVVSQRNAFQQLRNDPNPTSRQALTDLDYEFNSAVDAFLYVPRALQIGLLAPFPTMWSFLGIPSSSVFRNVVTWQMLLAYIAYPFLLWGMARGHQRAELAIGVFVALVFIVAYAMATPHLGVLDRFRYPFLTCLTTLGLAHGLGIGYRARASAPTSSMMRKFVR